MLLLLVFGAKRLPEIGRSLGSGMRGFKDVAQRRARHTIRARAGRRRTDARRARPDGTAPAPCRRAGRRAPATPQPESRSVAVAIGRVGYEDRLIGRRAPA